jgi:hypothetical protein
VFDAGFPDESRACAVKEKLSGVTGFPLISPVPGMIVKADGNPWAQKLCGGTPPEALIRERYAAPA